MRFSRHLIATSITSLIFFACPGGTNNDGGSGGGEGTGGSMNTGGGTGTGGGEMTGGGTATGGGDMTGGGTATGGGDMTGGGTATGGGDMTGGGTATGGGTGTGGGMDTDAGMVVPVTNDTCGTALDITSMLTATADGGTGTSFTVNLAGAHNDEGGSCSDPQDGNDAVYKITLTAPQDIRVAASPDNMVADPVVYIRKDDCTTGTELKCIDNQSPAAVEIALAKNQPAGDYFIFIDAYDNQSNGSVTVNVSLTAPTAPTTGDICSVPLDITPTGGASTRMESGTLVGFDADSAGSCGGIGPDAIYKLTLTAAKDVTLTMSTTEAMLTPLVHMRAASCALASAEYTNGCMGTLTPGQPATLSLLNVPAGEYFVYADSVGGSTPGPYTLVATLSGPTLPPANDVCTGAVDLTSQLTAMADGGMAATFTSNALSGNADYTGTCSTGTIAGLDLVYKVTLTGNHDITVLSTPDAGIDPVVYIRKSPCASGLELMCANEGQEGENEIATTRNQPAGDYFIFVDAFSAAASGNQTLQLLVTAPTTQIAGDTCASPIDVTSTLSATADGGTGTTFNVTAIGTYGDYVGTCRPSATSGRESVYKVTLSAAKDITIIATPTTDAGVDPFIYIRKADCTTGTEIACREATVENQSEGAFARNQAAGDYFIFVDAYNAATSGEQSISVALTGPTPDAPGDTCASAIDITSMLAATADGGTGLTVNPDLSMANAEYVGSCAAPSLSGKDVVYKLTLTSTKDITVSSTPSGMGDPVIYIKKGPCPTGTSVACADMGLMGGAEQAFANDQPAGDYFIFVDDYTAATSGPQAVTITVSGP